MTNKIIEYDKCRKIISCHQCIIQKKCWKEKILRDCPNLKKGKPTSLIMEGEVDDLTWNTVKEVLGEIIYDHM